MKKTIENLHQASQYVATAAISFLDKKADDSHTNLGWDIESSHIESRFFDKNNQLIFNLLNFELMWVNDEQIKAKIDLQTKTHKEILNWIKSTALKNGINKEYVYSLHYDLPYPTLTDDHVFTFDSSEVADYIVRQDIAKEAFQTFLNEHKLKSDIRIWPHHFDLGIYTQVDKAGKLFIGAGLAVPDTLVDDLYYYVSGYYAGTAINTSELEGLTLGDFRKDWKGATLASFQIDLKSATLFLKEANKTFISSID